MLSIADTIGVWAGIAQAGATVIAIMLGGLFAWRRGFIFRHEQPHVSILHEITHRRVSDSYVHIQLTATLQNSSRVKVEFRDALFTVQQIAPASDQYGEELYKTFIDNQAISLAWDILDEVHIRWPKDDLIAEPGETVAVTFEYLISADIESILVSTHFYNRRVVGEIEPEINPRNAARQKRMGLWPRRGIRGWNRTTAHDIMANKHFVKPDKPGETDIHGK